MFDREMSIRDRPTTLLQFFFQIVIFPKVMFKSIIGPDALVNPLTLIAATTGLTILEIFFLQKRF